jgi:hypothetical protein
VVTISTPWGRLLQFGQLGLDGGDRLLRVLARAQHTMPPATSPSPSSSAMPRRISGPSCTVATSPRRTGTPPRAASGMARKSSSVFR